MSVFWLNSEQIDEFWPLIGHHLKRLEDYGLTLAEAQREDLKSARRQLWGYQDGPVVLGVVITEIYETPRGKCCEIMGACGTESVKGQIEELLSTVERWAKDIGCVRMRLGGRPGWKRKLRDYEQVGIILEKSL